LEGATREIAMDLGGAVEGDGDEMGWKRRKEKAGVRRSGGKGYDLLKVRLAS
jgi:hypothetical protein